MAAKDNDDRKNDDQDAEVARHEPGRRQKDDRRCPREGLHHLRSAEQVLPPDQVSSEQIEDVMSMLSEMGINIIEDEEAEDEEQRRDRSGPGGDSREVAVSATETEKLDRTDDPVRMYLREMGSVELLSREGEIAIAKRIEAGRNTMIAGLCESPLTFQAITIWRDELLNEDILLRDVIDLETTFGNQIGEEEERRTGRGHCRCAAAEDQRQTTRNSTPTAIRSRKMMTTTRTNRPTCRLPRWKPR